MATAFRIQAGTSQELTQDCDASVAVNEFVYLDALGILQKARANSLITMPCYGYVVSKPNPTKCTIIRFLRIDNLVGIIPNKNYYISTSTPGAIQADIPGEGTILQVVAKGLSTTSLLIDINPGNYIVR